MYFLLLLVIVTCDVTLLPLDIISLVTIYSLPLLRRLVVTWSMFRLVYLRIVHVEDY